jgi:hypothetical protein
LVAGEPDTLVASFADVPELHDPIRGRVKGTRALRAFTSEISSWLLQKNFSVEDVGHVITERHGLRGGRSLLRGPERTSRSSCSDCGRPTVPRVDLSPAAGMTVYVRGHSKLAAAGIYDDSASARFG